MMTKFGLTILMVLNDAGIDTSSNALINGMSIDELGCIVIEK